LSGGASQEHAAGENGLRRRARGGGKRSRNHRLRGGCVSGFANSHEGTSDKQEGETAGEASGEGSDAPANNSEKDDGFATEAVSEESKGDAADGENEQEPSLQGTELRVGDTKICAKHGNKRDENPASGEVDKVDQNKYSKETELIGIERNGFGLHSELAPSARRNGWGMREMANLGYGLGQ
jgi:hypothetical protein